ncbi:calcium-binding protein [Rhodobacter sp. CZR27]|uniref:calcium-binding protein n=1 Tax=Rhodobacter sp. CZR27 TaxID=2033869 RepID=UPI000BBE7801|nr:calcium-binding protein [Rhodobacter sp. CZR27]
MAGQIFGAAFRDLDGDLTRDAREGIANTIFRVESRQTSTNAAGTYSMAVVPYSTADLYIRYNAVEINARVQFAEGDARIDLVNNSLLLSSATLTLVSGIHSAQLTGRADVNLFAEDHYYDDTFNWNLLKGNDGANVIGGLGGNDTLRGAGGDDSLYGDDDDDRLYGGTGDDRLYGGSGNDLLQGDAGNDTLDGSSGLDTLFGGLGDDVLYASSAFRVDGGAGIDTVSFYAYATLDVRLDLTTAQDTGDGRKILIGVENVTGGHYGDVITGNAANNRLMGEGGADLLTGQGGTDTLSGGTGADTLVGGAGNDWLDGGDGDGSYDWATFITSGAVSVDLDAGVVRSAAFGTDTITGVEGIRTGSGADLMVGDSDDNCFYGGAGNDSLHGGTGNDTLHGERGADVLVGGNGNDIFVFQAGCGADTIQGYYNEDIYIAPELANGAQSASQLYDMYALQTSGGILFDFGGGNRILLQNVSDISTYDIHIM